MIAARPFQTPEIGNAAAHYLASDHHVPGLLAHTAVHGYRVGFNWAAAIFAVGAIVSAPLFTAPGRSAEPSTQGDVRIRYARPEDTFLAQAPTPTGQRCPCQNSSPGDR